MKVGDIKKWLEEVGLGDLFPFTMRYSFFEILDWELAGSLRDHLTDEVWMEISGAVEGVQLYEALDDIAGDKIVPNITVSGHLIEMVMDWREDEKLNKTSE